MFMEGSCRDLRTAELEALASIRPMLRGNSAQKFCSRGSEAFCNPPRGGPGWVERMCSFLSGASRVLPMRRCAGQAGCQRTPGRVSCRQAPGAVWSGCKMSGSAPSPGARR